MNYSFNVIVEKQFDEAVALAKNAIASTNFGLVSEIPLHEKVQAKLNVDQPGYMLLGACNPANAYNAIQEDDNVGLLLPCNVVVKEKKHGLSEIATVDPVVSMSIAENEQVTRVAEGVKEAMEQIIQYVKENARETVS